MNTAKILLERGTEKKESEGDGWCEEKNTCRQICCETMLEAVCSVIPARLRALCWQLQRFHRCAQHAAPDPEPQSFPA